jgi:hypothetical protein
MPRHNVRFDYNRYAYLIKRGRGGKKAILRDCVLTQDGDDFIVTHNLFRTWEKRGEVYHKVTTPGPMARITPDNVVTLLYTEEVNMTTANRLGTLCGWSVGLNKRSYGNCEQHVRVYNAPNWQDSIPYFAGMQINLTSGRVLNPKPDVRRTLKQSAITEMTRKLATLRKLSKVMLKLNAFEELADLALTGRSHERMHQCVDITLIPASELFTDAPTAETVEQIIVYGLRHCTRPDAHTYSNGKWERVPADEHKAKWLDRALTYSLRDIREHHYPEEAYERITG